MSNTYTQLHIQLVFAVQFRAALIQPAYQERLHQYLTGITQHNQHKMLKINSMPDHLHLFIGLNPAQALSSFVQKIKAESTKWINVQRLTRGRFAWQQGYGAFSYSKSQVPQVIRYIQAQQHHHRKHTFLQEYQAFLKAFEVEFDERYIFKEPA